MANLNREDRLARAALCWALVIFTGCGQAKDDMPDTFKVTGTVAAKPDETVVGGAVQLVPLHGDSTFAVSGDIKADGDFSLHTVRGAVIRDGVPEGEYRITIIPPIPPSRRPLPLIVLQGPFRVEARDNVLSIDLTTALRAK